MDNLTKAEQNHLEADLVTRLEACGAKVMINGQFWIKMGSFVQCFESVAQLKAFWDGINVQKATQAMEDAYLRAKQRRTSE